MQTLWSDTLNSLNLSVSEDIRTTDTWVSALDDMGALAVTGPDAANFLQGQLSCDVAKIANNFASPGSHCNPQGRMISNFRLFSPAQDHYVLAMRDELCDIAQKALQKYIVFSKATLQRVDGLFALGLHGPEASNIVTHIFGSSPSSRNSSVQNSAGCAIQIDELAQSFELYLDPSNSDNLKIILQSALPCDKVYWEQQRLLNGLWYIGATQSGEHIPLVAALDKIEGISFKKGCYTGQEIIARMHYRGKAKRHVVALSCAPEHAIELGQKVFDTQAEKDMGEIVAIARTKNLTTLLAILNLPENEALPALTLNDKNGPTLS